MKPALKAPGIKHLKLNMMNRLPTLLSNSTCAAVPRARASPSRVLVAPVEYCRASSSSGSRTSPWRGLTLANHPNVCDVRHSLALNHPNVRNIRHSLALNHPNVRDIRHSIALLNHPNVCVSFVTHSAKHPRVCVCPCASLAFAAASGDRQLRERRVTVHQEAPGARFRLGPRERRLRRASGSEASTSLADESPSVFKSAARDSVMSTESPAESVFKSAARDSVMSTESPADADESPAVRDSRRAVRNSVTSISSPAVFRVLLAEDSPANRMAISRLIRQSDKISHIDTVIILWPSSVSILSSSISYCHLVILFTG